MSNVTEISVSKIDTKSEVNVRRLGIDDNVERVKSSIQQHGYWSDQPIVVRPHPDPDSGYEYQHITGQCRLRACKELELSEIPAVIEDISDEEAIQRSWGENEHRGELLMSDKAYWADYFYRHYKGNGYTGKEALDLAAKFLGVKNKDTVQKYFRLSMLPDEVMKLVDANLITSDQAGAIVKNTHDATHFDESQQKMKERADLLQKQRSPEGRKFVVEAMNELKHDASIIELSDYVVDKFEQIKHKVDIIIPTKLYDHLLKWGESRGLEDKTIIICHMIAETLRDG